MSEPGITDLPQPIPPSIIEQELHAIADLAESDQDRLALVYDVMGNLLRGRGDLYNEARQQRILQERTSTIGGAVGHFILPDIAGYGGDIHTIREAPGSYLVSPERTIVNCAQGEMWEIPLADNPTVGVGMSECSLLFAKTPEDTMIIAHISYSEPKEMEAVIQRFRDNGISPDQWYAVASVGAYQEKKAKQYDRYATVGRYESQGFLSSHIYPFEHKTSPLVIQGPYGDETVHVYNGLVSIILTSDECMIKQFSAWYDFAKGQEHVVAEPTYDSFSH